MFTYNEYSVTFATFNQETGKRTTLNHGKVCVRDADEETKNKLGVDPIIDVYIECDEHGNLRPFNVEGKEEEIVRNLQNENGNGLTKIDFPGGYILVSPLEYGIPGDEIRPEYTCAFPSLFTLHDGDNDNTTYFIDEDKAWAAYSAASDSAYMSITPMDIEDWYSLFPEEAYGNLEGEDTFAQAILRDGEAEREFCKDDNPALTRAYEMEEYCARQLELCNEKYMAESTDGERRLDVMAFWCQMADHWYDSMWFWMGQQ